MQVQDHTRHLGRHAVLAMLVERFDGRMLTWQVATEGLALAAFESGNSPTER
jgi:hypothetical protein